MNIKSLTLKNKIRDTNTDEMYWNLSSPSFKYISKYGVKALHYVTVDQAMRPDLVAIQWLGSSEYTDALCYVNNIFNPFSVKEGDILMIPNLAAEGKLYTRPKPAVRQNRMADPYIDTTQQTPQDQARIQRLIKKAASLEGGVDTPLPPNVLQKGQTAVKNTDDGILLGANIKTRQ
jgi:hypothetical protein